jgi:hypothetical protein
MDAEQREAFKDLRDSLERNHTRLEAKIDDARAAFTTHIVESAREHERIGSQVQVAHKRMDEHRAWHDKHQDMTLKRLSLWTAAVLGALGTALQIAKMIFGGKP